MPQNPVQGDVAIEDMPQVPPFPLDEEKGSPMMDADIPNVEKVKDESKSKSKKKKKKQKRTLMKANLPNEIRTNPQLLKYWYRRFQLFHRFDEGIQLDAGRCLTLLLVLFSATSNFY